MDGQAGFAGGVGVAYHRLGHAQDREHWRDNAHIRVRGPIVQFLEGSFYENFAESGAIITPVVDTVRLETGDERGASILLRSAPTGGSSELKRLYLLAIAMATALGRYHLPGTSSPTSPPCGRSPTRCSEG